MRYTSFEIKDEDKINKFLVAHGEHVAADGIITSEGRVGFLYEPQEEKERELDAVVGSTRQYVIQQIALMLGAEVDVRYWMGESLRGREVKPKIAEAEERIRQHQTHIRLAHTILNDSKKGKWKAFEDAQ